MGWDGLYPQNKPQTQEQFYAWIASENSGTCADGTTYKPLETHVKGDWRNATDENPVEIYIVLEVEKPGTPVQRFARVVLLRNSPTEFMWKTMDEHINPYYYDIPVHMFLKLSDFPEGEPENHKDWRKQVKANLDANRALNKRTGQGNPEKAEEIDKAIVENATDETDQTNWTPEMVAEYAARKSAATSPTNPDGKTVTSRIWALYAALKGSKAAKQRNYVLDAVHVNQGHLVVTDGSFLLIEPKGRDEELNNVNVRPEGKWTSPHISRDRVHSELLGNVFVTSLGAKFEIIDGRYPNIDAVYPQKYDRPIKLMINAELLARMATVLSADNPKDRQGIIILEFEAPLLKEGELEIDENGIPQIKPKADANVVKSVITVTGNNSNKTEGVIMPCVYGPPGK